MGVREVPGGDALSGWRRVSKGGAKGVRRGFEGDGEAHAAEWDRRESWWVKRMVENRTSAKASSPNQTLLVKGVSVCVWESVKPCQGGSGGCTW